MYRRALAAGLAFAIGMSGVTSANAGLLDFIFGWRNRTDLSTPPTRPTAHPSVTINSASMSKKKIARAKKRTPKAPVQLSPAEMMARTIDPYSNPNWWLEDPTLRKGDILVLKDRVVVFSGGAVGAPKSYVALERTKLLSRSERRQVAAMTGFPREPVMLANSVPVVQPKVLKSVSLAGPVQPRVLGEASPRS